MQQNVLIDPFSVPRVGIAVLLFNDEGKILLGKRLGSHGAGTWSVPGGHLDYGESLEGCAKRELLEETGIKDVIWDRVVDFRNSVLREENRHYITIFLRCNTKEEPIAMEPNKCKEWLWFDLNYLPVPLFECFADLVYEGGL